MASRSEPPFSFVHLNAYVVLANSFTCKMGIYKQNVKEFSLKFQHSIHQLISPSSKTANNCFKGNTFCNHTSLPSKKIFYELSLWSYRKRITRVYYFYEILKPFKKLNLLFSEKIELKD